MLNYRINRNNIINDNDLIAINNAQIIDTEPLNRNLSNTKCYLICYTNNVETISIGKQLYVTHTILVSYDNYEASTHEITEFYNVQDVNTANASFTIEFDKYKELAVDSFSKMTIKENDDDGNEIDVDYLYVYFHTPHFFNKVGTDNYIWLAYKDDFLRFPSINDDFALDIITNYAVRVKWANVEKSALFDYINNVLTYPNILQVYTINYLFSTVDDCKIYYINPKLKLPIGLTNKFQTDLQKEQCFLNYVQNTKSSSINTIVDMEKDIYYPVVKIRNNENNYEYKPIRQIIYNFHFREHRGDNWTVETNSYWNGVKTGTNEMGLPTISFIDEFFNIKNEESEQSDLLSYLNFTNNDVKYQKNKLKKSFIRQLYYDSPNMGNQNLLSYSTMFMNGRNYYNKYIKHFETNGYRTIDEDYVNADESVHNDLEGIRVNREYSNGEDTWTNEDYENYRLSSQIVVKDKYNSTVSSDGFYQYLWHDLLPDNGNGTLTLYSKIEFNHAGLGRIVPFMMPYWDRTKWVDKEGIKSFQEIINDWHPYSVITQVDGKYGTKMYNKFSYIQYKIGYDNVSKKYIYYLDNDCYGDLSIKKVYNENTATLTLNLYEAKMI